MNIIKKISNFFGKKNKSVITEYPVFSPCFFTTPNTVDILRKIKFIQESNKYEDIEHELMAMDYTTIMKIISKKNI